MWYKLLFFTHVTRLFYWVINLIVAHFINKLEKLLIEIKSRKTCKS